MMSHYGQSYFFNLKELERGYFPEGFILFYTYEGKKPTEAVTV